MEAIGYLSLFLVGLSLGALGSGGSILSVPILVYLFSMDTVLASGYSLFVVGSSSLLGACFKYKEQRLSLRVALLFGVPSIISIFCSRKWLLPLVPDVIYASAAFQLHKSSFLLALFALLMILAASWMITGKNASVRKLGNIRFRHPYLVVLGLVTGCISGFAGIGGGFLIIPVLVSLTSLPLHAAIGTALLIIAGNSFIGFAGDITNFTIDWTFLFRITGLSMAGLFIGIRFTRFVPAQKLRLIFGWFILIAGLVILLRELHSMTVYGWRFTLTFDPAAL